MARLALRSSGKERQRSVTELLGSELSVSDARSLLDRSRRITRLPSGIERRPCSIGGVLCEWLRPDKAEPRFLIVYLHGGGFVLGRTALHLGLAATLGMLTNAQVLMVDYRLAPEHPYPAALEDVVIVYRTLVAQGWEPSCIAIAGDSAGGNLVLAALLRVRDAGDPLPAVAACLSPVVDLTDSEARSRRAGDRALRPEVVALFNAAYLNGHDPRDPFVSPVYADLRGLPPLVIHAGGAELLREDAERIAAAARAAGVDVELAIYPGMGHVWQLQLDVPAARDSVREIARFVRQHLPRAA